jgi:hypothetical protein
LIASLTIDHVLNLEPRSSIFETTHPSVCLPGVRFCADASQNPHQTNAIATAAERAMNRQAIAFVSHGLDS